MMIGLFFWRQTALSLGVFSDTALLKINLKPQVVGFTAQGIKPFAHIGGNGLVRWIVD